MKIIAQKSNNQNTTNFIEDSLTQEYIDAMSFNVTYTKDNSIVVFSENSVGIAVTNTINDSTLKELQGYEIILLDKLLKDLSEQPEKKDVYLNLAPTNQGVLSDENIKDIAKISDRYVENVKNIVEKYKNLTIHIHSVSRNLVTKLKEKITNFEIGFAFTGNDLSFIDVDYYVIVSNTRNDNIIDILLKENKKVIIYITSDYYISYLYEHYLGEKSTPYLQQTINKLSIMTNYPAIINKVFKQ